MDPFTATERPAERPGWAAAERRAAGSARSESSAFRRAAGQAGFTLIEVILGLAILVLILGGVYAVASGSVQLSTSVSASQQREILTHNFLGLCRRNFEGMPGNASVTLETSSYRGADLFALVFRKYPLAFSWPSVPATTGRVVLLTDVTARGSLGVYLVYVDEVEEEQEQEVDYWRIARGEAPGVRLLLVDGVRELRWRFYDQQNEEWVEVWDNQALRPTLIEMELLYVGTNDVRDLLRTVFWAPTVANPEQLFGNPAAGVPAPGGGQPGAGQPGAGGPPGGGRPGVGGPGAGNRPPGAPGGGRGPGAGSRGEGGRGFPGGGPGAGAGGARPPGPPR